MPHLRHANATQLHFCSGVPRYSSALLMVTVFSMRPFSTCLNPAALSGRSLTVSSVPVPPAEAAVVTATGALWSPTHPTFPLPSLSVNLCRFWWVWACVYVDFLWNRVQVARCISYFFQHSCLSSTSAQWRGSSSPEPLHPVCWTWEAGEKLWHRSAFCIKTSSGWFLMLQPCLFHPLLETCPDPGSVTTEFALALAWEVHWPDSQVGLVACSGGLFQQCAAHPGVMALSELINKNQNGTQRQHWQAGTAQKPSHSLKESLCFVPNAALQAAPRHGWQDVWVRNRSL